ncbi:MAG: BON domain-containing protein [Deltaproteobacteria bacterium]|nr:BON domain-containing protein [Deltaproteobacteria bacterium]
MNERNGIQTENRPDGRNGIDRDGNERNPRSGQQRFGIENDDRGLSGRDFTRDDDRGRSLGQRGGYEQRDFGGRGSERDAEYRGQLGPDRDFDRSSPSYGGQSDRDSRMESRGHDRGEGNYSFGEDRFGADRSVSQGQRFGRDDARGSMDRWQGGRDGYRMQGSSDGWQRGRSGGYGPQPQQSYGRRGTQGYGMTSSEGFGAQHGFGSQESYGREGSQGYGMGAYEGFGWQQSLGRQDSMKSGKAPKNYTRSDERLREEVCDALANSGHDWSDVEVTVSNGEVTLTGTVSDRSEKLQAEHMADRVRGVNEVTNQLKIKRADSSASRTSSTESSSTKDSSDNNASRRRSA